MLTPSQLALLNTDIQADPMFAGWFAEEISREYNKSASPSWTVWRTSVTWDEIMLNGMDWARVDNLSVGKARIWDWMFQNAAKSCNPSKANIRAGIDATWVGTAADLAVRASVYTHCKRAANRIEKLLSTGTGSDASPATMGYEGTINYRDVEAAIIGSY